MTRHTLTAVADRFRTAVETGVLIIGQCNDGPSADHDVTTALFADLNDTLLSIPPDDGYRINTATACSAAYKAVDYLAARWQIVQLVRRLRDERERWEGLSVADLVIVSD